jgi:hypothetical protein
VRVVSGGIVLVCEDTSPPKLDTTGKVTGADGTLVLLPGLWVGTR